MARKLDLPISTYSNYENGYCEPLMEKRKIKKRISYGYHENMNLRFFFHNSKTKCIKISVIVAIPNNQNE